MSYFPVRASFGFDILIYVKIRLKHQPDIIINGTHISIKIKTDQ